MALISFFLSFFFFLSAHSSALHGMVSSQKSVCKVQMRQDKYDEHVGEVKRKMFLERKEVGRQLDLSLSV